VANLPALSEAVMLKVFQGFQTKFKDVVAWDFAKKQAFFDRLKALMNYFLLLPDNPELEHFKNMLTLLDLIKSMNLKGADRIFYLDFLAHFIHSLAIQVTAPNPSTKTSYPSGLEASSQMISSSRDRSSKETSRRNLWLPSRSSTC
jgi:hypothetical protein